MVRCSPYGDKISLIGIVYAYEEVLGDFFFKE